MQTFSIKESLREETSGRELPSALNLLSTARIDSLARSSSQRPTHLNETSMPAGHYSSKDEIASLKAQLAIAQSRLERAESFRLQPLMLGREEGWKGSVGEEGMRIRMGWETGRYSLRV
jgi:hypothetical protein